MILNNSYNNKEINRRIIGMVGEPFGFWERLKRRGIGSRRMVIIDASHSIQKELSATSGTAYCIIELRPKGVLVHFRKRLEAMVWVVPYYRLALFQNGTHFSLHSGGEFIRIGALANQSPDFEIVRKIITEKSNLANRDDLNLYEI
jgi:hypothetical protein